MYEPPLIVKFSTEVSRNADDAVMGFIRKMEISASKKDLVAALEYDRGQYEKGFDEGKACTVRMIEKARHALGMDNSCPCRRCGRLYYTPYRNGYCAGPGDVADWEAACSCGYAVKIRGTESTYRLTRAGMDWLGQVIGVTIKNEED